MWRKSSPRSVKKIWICYLDICLTVTIETRARLQRPLGVGNITKMEHTLKSSVLGTRAWEGPTGRCSLGRPGGCSLGRPGDQFCLHLYRGWRFFVVGDRALDKEGRWSWTAFMAWWDRAGWKMTPYHRAAWEALEQQDPCTPYAAVL